METNTVSTVEVGILVGSLSTQGPFAEDVECAQRSFNPRNAVGKTLKRVLKEPSWTGRDQKM